jgi:hypothetical protein
MDPGIKLGPSLGWSVILVISSTSLLKKSISMIKLFLISLKSLYISISMLLRERIELNLNSRMR